MSNAYDPSEYPPTMPIGSASGADVNQSGAPYSAASPYASAPSGAPYSAASPYASAPSGAQPGFQQPGGAAYAQDPGAQQGYYPGAAPGQMPYPQAGVGYYDQKSKVAAGLLGIFLGTLGVHNFYLGYTNKAIGQLVGTIVGFVLSIIVIGIFIVLGIQIWALVEGILILSAQPGSQPWGVDARGVPLSS
ncbi:TM2 domain-containing protein [Actinomyces israelii]|uniref:TM2 domain-containing protein n=1 Tax=Actinomyces israelii TaxID=1659 RepID=UPI0025537F7B|nr:NINE protein [Actinomyces israelii]WKR22957.1 hypothetical protein AIF0345_2919 [Actinomyces israelii]